MELEVSPVQEDKAVEEERVERGEREGWESHN